MTFKKGSISPARGRITALRDCLQGGYTNDPVWVMSSVDQRRSKQFQNSPFFADRSVQRSFFRWRSSVLKLKPPLWQNSLRRMPLLTNPATNC